MELFPELKNIKVPTEKSRLWKDECCYCFDTPETGEGLFIDLIGLLAFSKKYVQLNYQKTHHHLYLNYKKVAIVNEKVTSPTVENGGEEKPPKKLAIGVEGGFNVEDEEIKYEEHYKIYIFPDDKFLELSDPLIPKGVLECCEKIKTMNSQSRKEEIVSWNAESVFPSAFAESIIQLENTNKKINPRGPWRCDIDGCDKVENLWLNLTDGFIGCGRKYADGTGGNGHAQEHFDQTQYPISVKLGTITKDHADVYSYPEGDMVSDPLLFQHLTHWGLNPNVMVKTEKSMAELELDQNLNFEFGKIQEKGKLLENVFGPGLTGIENLGNSCYMSSVIQMIFAIDSFQTRYLKDRESSFKDITQDPTQSFEIQMSKLAHGLLSGEYSVPLSKPSKNANEESEAATQVGIAPKMFKSLIGTTHPEFSTMRQQDAHEYLQYLLEYIERSERSRPSWIQQTNPTRLFQFHNEDRIECGSSGQVKYTRRLENILSVPVPMEDATNKQEVAEYEEKLKQQNGVRQKDQEEVRPIIPLIACINGFVEPYRVDDFLSPATGGKTFSLNSSRMATFPEVLIIHLKKYTYNADYTPKKLNVFMDVPDVIDIDSLRGRGIKEGEVPLKEGTTNTKAPEPTFNQEILDTLLSMDFPLVRCKKALLATGGKDAEQAMNWIFEHIDDPDIDIEPPVITNANNNDKLFVFNPVDVDNIIGMGFTDAQAKLALKSTKGNLERAADWLFSHIDNLDELVQKDIASTSQTSPSSIPQSTNSLQPVSDGIGKYELLGFISHLGNSVTCGHYVCHIKKNGRWIKFNDRHVQLSEQPPKELGYIYFYKRQLN